MRLQKYSRRGRDEGRGILSNAAVSKCQRRRRCTTPVRRGVLMGRRSALSACICLFLTSACQKAKPPPQPSPTVQVVEVVQKDVPIYREWVGSLDGFTNADIKPQVTGYVRKQVYREGSAVHAGDILFLIDPRNYKEAADAAQATLQSSIAALTR